MPGMRAASPWAIGGVGFGGDAVAAAEFEYVEWHVAYMGQYLIDGRLDFAVLEDVPQVVHHKVRDADGAQLAGLQRVLKCAVGFHVALIVAVVALVDLDPRLRGVDDHHVQIIQARLPERLIDAGLG